MPSIFDFASNDAVDPKMHVSQGSLPPYIDAAQPPTKRSPWCQIQKLSFIHTLTMVMPDEMYEIIWNALDVEVKKIKYAKVIMKLQEVLEGDFFTEYIKKGKPAFTYEYFLISLSLSFDDMLCFRPTSCCTAGTFHKHTIKIPLLGRCFGFAIPAVVIAEEMTLLT